VSKEILSINLNHQTVGLQNRELRAAESQRLSVETVTADVKAKKPATALRKYIGKQLLVMVHEAELESSSGRTIEITVHIGAELRPHVRCNVFGGIKDPRTRKVNFQQTEEQTTS
jgi:hypothetical protein